MIFASLTGLGSCLVACPSHGPGPHTSQPRLIGFRALTLLALAVVGCGPGVGLSSVQGTVTFRGHPLPLGSVTFVPPSGPSASGDVRDGRFELVSEGVGRGALPGRYAVAIVSVEDTTGRRADEQPGSPSIVLPMKYTTASTSELTAEVKEGPNEFTFNLE